MLSHKLLYAGILAGLVLMLTASLGNGLWNIPADYSDWNYLMFRGICHQMPERSLMINDIPMAVNSRCFGIFSGLTATWILLPFLLPLLIRFRQEKKLLLFAALLQIIDNTAGRLNLWTGSNSARLLMGFALGAAVVLAVGDLFSMNNKKNEHHGNSRHE